MTEDETLKLKCLETALQFGRSLADAQAMYSWIKDGPAPEPPPQPEPVADGLTLEEGGDVSGRGWVEPPLDPMTLPREDFFEEPSEHELSGLPREDFYNDPPVDEQCQTEPVLSADYHEASASSEPSSEEDVRSEPPAPDEESPAPISDEPLDLAALTRAAQEKLDAKEALEELTTDGWVGARIFDWSTVRGTDVIEARYEDGFCERLLFAGYTPVTREPEWKGTHTSRITHIRAFLKTTSNAEDDIIDILDEELEDA